MVFGAIMAGASMATGAIGAHKARTAARTNRKRTRKTLKYGRSIYGSLADQGIEQMRMGLTDVQGGVSSALGESVQAEKMGMQDIDAGLQQRLAAMRTGVGGSLAGSSVYPEAQRGARSDALRALMSHRAQGAQQRAGIHMGGAQMMLSARDRLNQALQTTGKFKYGIQQDMAAVWGQGGQQQQSSPDFGGLGAMLDGVDWGSMFGGGKGIDNGYSRPNVGGKQVQGPMPVGGWEN